MGRLARGSMMQQEQQEQGQQQPKEDDGQPGEGVHLVAPTPTHLVVAYVH